MINSAGIIRVTIVSNQRIIREGIRSLLIPFAHIRIVSEFSLMDEAMINSLPMTTDLSFVTLDHRSALPLLSRCCLSGLPSVVLLPDPSKSEVISLQCAGVRGLLPQGSIGQDYIDAIQAFSSGKSYISTQFDSFLQETTLPPNWESLTNRERLCFCLLSSGLSSAEIAFSMNVSTVAVRSYRQRLYRKLEITDAAGIAIIASQFGIVAQC